MWRCAIFFFWWVAHFLQFNRVPFPQKWVSLDGVSHSLQRIGATFKHQRQLRPVFEHGYIEIDMYCFKMVSGCFRFSKAMRRGTGHPQWSDRGPHCDGPCLGRDSATGQVRDHQRKAPFQDPNVQWRYGTIFLAIFCGRYSLTWLWLKIRVPNDPQKWSCLVGKPSILGVDNFEPQPHWALWQVPPT